MTRGLGPLSDEEARALHKLWEELMALKPERWSVVKGQSALDIRPPERRLGKFSVIHSAPGMYYGAFYSQRERHWTNHTYFAINDDVAGEIMQWMVSIVAE